jgi:hypothetical protein
VVIDFRRAKALPHAVHVGNETHVCGLSTDHPLQYAIVRASGTQVSRASSLAFAMMLNPKQVNYQRAVVGAVVALLLLVLGADSQTTTSPQEPGGISGHVYRADTAALLPHAFVMVTPTKAGDFGDGYRVFTDRNGAYSIKNVLPGAYVVEAQAPGFLKAAYGERGQDGAAEEIELKAGEKLQNIDLRLLPDGVISGTIFDHVHRPVKGIRVDALHRAFYRGGSVALFENATTKTDELGRFRLAALDPGSYYIQVAGHYGTFVTQSAEPGKRTYAAMYYPRAASISEAERVPVAAAEEHSGIDIILPKPDRTYTIHGTISNFEMKKDSNDPYITLIAAPGTGDFSAPSETWTAKIQANGSFSIPGIPPGDYSLGPYTYDSPPGGAIGSPVVIRDGDVIVNIPMQQPGEVKGKVVLDAGAGAILFRLMSIQLQSADDGSLPMPLGFSGISEDGGFDIPNIPPGLYHISVETPRTSPNYLKEAQCSGVDYTTQPLTISSGAMIGNCKLTIANDSGIVDGQAMNDDKPVREMEIVAIPQSRALRRSPAFSRMALRPTDADGRFVLVGLIPGDYLLFAVPEDPERGYFALDFADRNSICGEPVTIIPRETKSVNLKVCLSPK